MITFNKADIKDKILACWVGKNIGGTMGGPYESQRKILDIEGFSTEEGTVLPNDDLDLQLCWLKAIEERGPLGITGPVLGEYWLNFIPPSWNEYGIGKGNLRMGLLPPLSGEYKNYWKHSNGAWIRSEIWACCTPGCPDIAIKYAVEDAMVDHGMAEGTYAEMFTAAMESAAFACNDIRKLINIGLAKIPEDCRLAKAINTVLECYDNGTDWKECREILTTQNTDLHLNGWFQAPQNVAFTILGLLYGECDFKKSMIIAINCGDDTDCTGATCGALLGIMGGMKAIPEDWSKYIGDNIVSIAINRGDLLGTPTKCTELTDRVMALIPGVLHANYADARMSDHDETDISGFDYEKALDRTTAKKLYSRPGWSYEIPSTLCTTTVIFDGEPCVKPGGQLKFKLSILGSFPNPHNVKFNWFLPEGWTVDGPGSLYVDHRWRIPEDEPRVAEFTLNVGEDMDAFNRVVVEISEDGRPTMSYVPVFVIRD